LETKVLKRDVELLELTESLLLTLVSFLRDGELADRRGEIFSVSGGPGLHSRRGSG
jgi:hypothetical protein